MLSDRRKCPRTCHFARFGAEGFTRMPSALKSIATYFWEQCHTRLICLVLRQPRHPAIFVKRSSTHLVNEPKEKSMSSISRRHLLAATGIVAASAAPRIVFAQAAVPPRSGPAVRSSCAARLSDQCARAAYRRQDDGNPSRPASSGLCHQPEQFRQGQSADRGKADRRGAGNLGDVPEAHPHRRAQQYRRPCQPHHVLADHGPGRRQARGRRARRHRPRPRRPRKDADRLQRRRRARVRLRLGVRHRRARTASSRSRPARTRTTR